VNSGFKFAGTQYGRECFCGNVAPSDHILLKVTFENPLLFPGFESISFSVFEQSKLIVFSPGAFAMKLFIAVIKLGCKGLPDKHYSLLRHGNNYGALRIRSLQKLDRFCSKLVSFLFYFIFYVAGLHFQPSLMFLSKA
jgi:hypothetical protein